MLKLIIEDDEGRKTIVPFVRGEITIGRQEGNTVRLTERNVSRRHARLLRENGTVTIEDLGSYNGVRVNGTRLDGPIPVRDGDLIQIGDYDLALEREISAADDGDPVEDTLTAADPQSDAGAPPMEHDSPTAVVHIQDVEEEEEAVTMAGAEPARPPGLLVLNTAAAGRFFVCDEPELRIGRADDNHIVIDHRSLSGTHASLIKDGAGHWHVRDLDSARGVAVNGEPRQEALLQAGDVVELGRVRLRFTPPEFRPEAPPRSRPRAARVVGSLALLATTGAAAAALFPGRAAEVAAWAQGAVAGLSSRSTASAEPASPPAEDPRLETARSAMAQRDFQGAVAQLQGVNTPDGSLSAEATVLLARAQGELQARRSLDAAEERLRDGRWDEAEDLVSQAEGSLAFAEERESLKEKLEAARKPLSSEVERICDEGAQLLERRQYKNAEAALRQCVQMNPAHARCHKLLGTTYAHLRDPERGAVHYRRFLALAPTDPQADAVKRILESYELSRKGN
ncbi:MAG TPA: FHA domain-containing protein [Myxococcaceae bacterium]|nr:FHA domain-containing protein [Myxococcaceae bacterium]